MPDHRSAKAVGETCRPAPSRGDGAPATGGRRTATRADLLDAVATTCPHLPRAQVRAIFEALLDEVSGTLRRGEPVKLRSFGQFAVRTKRERLGRNPRTGVEVPITPRRVLTFRASSVLLGLVNGAAPAALPDGGEGGDAGEA